MNENCPQCNRVLGPKLRLIREEVCGHLKCKQCLLDEDDGCLQCEKAINDEKPPNAFTALKVEAKLSDTQQDSLNDDETGIVKKSLMDRMSSLDGDYGLTELGYEVVDVNPLDSGVEEPYSVDNIEETDEETEDLPIIETVIKLEDRIADDSDSQGVKQQLVHKPKGVPSHVIDTEIENTANGVREKGFKCTICTKSFRSIHQIRYHLYCDPEIEKPYKCKDCSLTFRTGYQLKQHAHLHGNLRFECTKCGKQFSHDASARKHYKKHEPGAKIVRKPQPTGEYPCEVCGKIFARKDYRKKHMICHEGEKKYSCMICEKTYVRFNALKFHVQTTHDKSEEWECNDCKKTFATKQSLDRHRLVHVGVKPMHCKICGLRSTRKDNLLRHVRSFHPDSQPQESIEFDTEMIVEALSENDESQSGVQTLDMIDEMKKHEIRSNEAQLRRNVIVMKGAKGWMEHMEEDEDGNQTVQYIDENDIIEHETNSNNDDMVMQMDSMQGTIVVLGIKDENTEAEKNSEGSTLLTKTSSKSTTRGGNQAVASKKADIYRKILLAQDDDDVIEEVDDAEVVQII